VSEGLGKTRGRESKMGRDGFFARVWWFWGLGFLRLEDWGFIGRGELKFE